MRQPILKTRRAHVQMTRIQCKTGENVIVLSVKYTPVTQSRLCLIFLMCIATMHRLNYSGQEARIFFSPVYDSDVPVTLK